MAIVINNNVSLHGYQYYEIKQENYLVPHLSGVPCYIQICFDCVVPKFFGNHPKPKLICACSNCAWKHHELSKEQAVAWSSNHTPMVNLERPRSIRWCSWKKPESGWTKLNTDGSVSTKRDKAGIGGIFRDHTGDPLCGYVFKVPRDDIFLVELWAIWQGLIHAVTLGVKMIWIESDSLHAVNTINRKQRACGSKASNALKNIWEFLEKFEKYNVTHSWREANKAADHLAKMDISGSDIILWPKYFPRTLNKIVEDDANGKRYQRRG